MKIFIEETDDIKHLSLIDPRGQERIEDFVWNAGPEYADTLPWDEEREGFLCSQATFNWWENIVTAHQSLYDRMAAIVKEQGEDALYNVIGSQNGVAIEERAAHMNRVLDAAFGPVG